MLLHARIQELSSGGVQVSLIQKSSDGFFCFFLVLSLFYRSQMVNFEEIYHFSKFQRGSNIFQGGGGGGGGSNFFQGGSNCLFPIETHITCDFPGGVRTPCPPSGSALVLVIATLLPHPFQNIVMRLTLEKQQLQQQLTLILKKLCLKPTHCPSL